MTYVLQYLNAFSMLFLCCHGYQGLFLLAQDENIEVRKNVCRGLVLMTEMRIPQLVPHIHAIVEVQCTNT